MAHNHSASKRAAWLRESPLGNFAGFFLTCECARCRTVGWVQVDRLIGTRGADMADKPVGQVIALLRCKNCRELPARVSLSNGNDDRPVWGPGAF